MTITKKQTLWQKFIAIIQRALKPTPRKPFDPNTDVPTFSADDVSIGGVMSNMVGRVVITVAVVAGTSVLASSYFSGGLVDAIARAYVGICTTSGVCDLPTLNAAFATGNVVLLTLVILMGYAVFSFEDIYSDQQAFYAELEEAIVALHDHIERNGAVMSEMEDINTKLARLQEAVDALRK